MQIKTLHTTFRRHLKSLQSTGKLHCGRHLATIGEGSPIPWRLIQASWLVGQLVELFYINV